MTKAISLNKSYSYIANCVKLIKFQFPTPFLNAGINKCWYSLFVLMMLISREVFVQGWGEILCFKRVHDAYSANWGTCCSNTPHLHHTHSHLVRGSNCDIHRVCSFLNPVRCLYPLYVRLKFRICGTRKRHCCVHHSRHIVWIAIHHVWLVRKSLWYKSIHSVVRQSWGKRGFSSLLPHHIKITQISVAVIRKYELKQTVRLTRSDLFSQVDHL